MMFSCSLDFNIRYRYMYLVKSLRTAKTHALLSEEKPHGEGHEVEKVDCVRHVQKRMGSTLCELKKQYRGQELSDGKTLEVLED